MMIKVQSPNQKDNKYHRIKNQLVYLSLYTNHYKKNLNYYLHWSSIWHVHKETLSYQALLAVSWKIRGYWYQDMLTLMVPITSLNASLRVLFLKYFNFFDLLSKLFLSTYLISYWWKARTMTIFNQDLRPIFGCLAKSLTVLANNHSLRS